MCSIFFSTRVLRLRVEILVSLNDIQDLRIRQKKTVSEIKNEANLY